MIFPLILRTPDEGGSTPGTVGQTSPNTPTKARAGAPAPAKPAARANPQTPAKHTPRAAPVVEDAPANNNGETAADRARARKAEGDSAAGRTRGAKGQVKSLEDIRKLGSERVAAEKRKTGTVTTDPEALEGYDPSKPKLETGRPEPKRSPKSDPPPPPVAEDVVDEIPDNIEDLEVASDNEEVVDEEVAAEEEVNEYVPNTKFKAYGEEFDIPERFQGLLTDPEAEAEVHDVFTRAHAFDKTKGRLEQYHQEVQTELMPELSHYRNIRGTLSDIASRADIFELCEQFGLDENKVLRAAADRIKLLDAAPEVRQLEEQRRATEKANRDLARRLDAQEARTQESDKLAKRTTFESLLARDDVRAMADEFDSRFQQPGTFSRMVAQYAHGIYVDSQNKGKAIDLSPAEAISGFMKQYGLTLPTTGQPAKRPTPPANRPTQPAKPAIAAPARQVKVMSNLGARPAGATTSRPEFKNLDEIKNYRKQQYGR